MTKAGHPPDDELSQQDCYKKAISATGLRRQDCPSLDHDSAPDRAWNEMEATIRRRPDSARPQADLATVEAGILALQTFTRCSGYSAAMTWA
jgi:hypothetical protein